MQRSNQSISSIATADHQAHSYRYEDFDGDDASTSQSILSASTTSQSVYSEEEELAPTTEQGREEKYEHHEEEEGDKADQPEDVGEKQHDGGEGEREAQRMAHTQPITRKEQQQQQDQQTKAPEQAQEVTSDIDALRAKPLALSLDALQHGHAGIIYRSLTTIMHPHTCPC
jgi:hypothetical protein